MKQTWCVAILCLGLLVALGACDDEAVTPTATGPFQLTFQGDASFQGPHPGHTIYVAVVRAADGAVVASQTGTVSATADPAFSFSFPGLVVVGVAYQVHYWIDSNFGGGTAGVCDAPSIDHQWSVAVATVQADVSITELHNAATVTDVCATFP